MPDSLADVRKSDALVQADLVALFASRHAGIPAKELRAGQLFRNYFSILFAIDAPCRRRWMVKIPKADLRSRSEKGILPLTDEDRALGRAEFESLELLNLSWRGRDVEVEWVRPVAYLEDYNAVVTERVEGEDATKPYRRLALRDLAGSADANRELSSALSRIGTALSRFHEFHAQPRTVAGADIIPRLHGYIERLRAQGAGISLRSQAIVEALRNARWATMETTTLKGIDIRNVLLSDEGRIWLLDPGKTKRAPREADLSRFILTWRILFWGSPWFGLRISPRQSLESAFLAGYDQLKTRDSSILNVYLLKELLKHWLTAYDALSLQHWDKPQRDLVRAVYIEPFYRRQLDRLLDTLN